MQSIHNFKYSTALSPKAQQSALHLGACIPSCMAEAPLQTQAPAAASDASCRAFAAFTSCFAHMHLQTRHRHGMGSYREGLGSHVAVAAGGQVPRSLLQPGLHDGQGGAVH